MNGLIHVTKELLTDAGNKGPGNTLLTYCGLTLVDDPKRDGPYVWWAGWRATCEVCFISSAPRWRPLIVRMREMLAHVGVTSDKVPGGHRNLYEDVWKHLASSGCNEVKARTMKCCTLLRNHGGDHVDEVSSPVARWT